MHEAWCLYKFFLVFLCRGSVTVVAMLSFFQLFLVWTVILMASAACHACDKVKLN